jgi:hypothetical protein
MPCLNSVTFKIDFNFAAAAIASAIVRLELNTILDLSSLDLEHEFYPCFSRNIFGENAIYFYKISCMVD